MPSSDRIRVAAVLVVRWVTRCDDMRVDFAPRLDLPLVSVTPGTAAAVRRRPAHRPARGSIVAVHRGGGVDQYVGRHGEAEVGGVATNIIPRTGGNTTILSYNQTFITGGTWLVPTDVLTARTTKLTVQYDF